MIHPPDRHLVLRHLTIVAALLVSLTACDEGAPTDPVTAPTATEPAPDVPVSEGPEDDEPPPQVPVDDAPLVGSWTEAFEVDLPDGQVAGDCEGDAPLICVRDGGGELLGDLALLEFAAGPEFADDAEAALRSAAEGFVASFGTDRAEGCADFVYAADAVSPANVGATTAVRTGFTLTDAEGRVVERVVVHLAYADGALWTVQTDAYVAEGGCLPPSDVDPSFTPEVLAALEAPLDRLVSGTPLPPATGA